MKKINPLTFLETTPAASSEMQSSIPLHGFQRADSEFNTGLKM